MSFEDVVKTYKPKDNDAKAIISGDFVAQVQKLHKHTGQDGRNWIIFETSIINVVKAKEDNQSVEGDEITRMYNEDEDDSLKRFFNDMFTAGIDLDTTSKEAMYASFENAVNKLVYFRGWMRPATEKYPNPSQAVIIKSKNMLTAENSQSKLPF